MRNESCLGKHLNIINAHNLGALQTHLKFRHEAGTAEPIGKSNPIMTEQWTI